MKFENILILFLAFFLFSCASQPKDIDAAYISPLKYKDFTCDELAMVQIQVEEQRNILFASLKREADADQTQAIVGTLLFWPAYFWLEGGDSAEAGEYARLKGEYNAIESASTMKKCFLEFKK